MTWNTCVMVVIDQILDLPTFKCYVAVTTHYTDRLV